MEGVAGAEPAAPKKPALLKGGMVVAWIYAAVLALYLFLVDKIPIAGTTEVILTGKGLPPQGTRMTLDLVNSTRAFLTPLLILSIVVAYGLAKDRHWSRWVMMLLLILGGVLIPAPLASAINYGLSVALAVFGWWYLYRKPNVVAYYQAIKQRQLH